jgi:SnoaL-like protein
MGPARDAVAVAMRRINDAWLKGRVDDMAPLIHDDIVQVLPGFSGRAEGREKFLNGFRDFAKIATIPHFHEGEHQVDVVGRTATVTFDYEMVYELSGARYRVTGRELWIFENDGSAWRAVWRAMLDVTESPADAAGA